MKEETRPEQKVRLRKGQRLDDSPKMVFLCSQLIDRIDEIKTCRCYGGGNSDIHQVASSCQTNTQRKTDVLEKKFNVMN